ncbi:MAG: hypothetical protein HeimC3_54140 [Candidatus Heimdallarchaeota archaeon LC_3]|nr:MAG: hypothetical protein HeimC3_54140 [Candidatus Heimdallarchaeota archaeon LC_3]
MISNQIELDSLLKDIYSFLNIQENFQKNFLNNFFLFVEENSIESNYIDCFEFIELIKVNCPFDNINEIIFGSFLKTYAEISYHNESFPNFLSKLLVQYPNLCEEFEKSIISISTQLEYANLLVLFKLIKSLNYQYRDFEVISPFIYWYLVGELFCYSDWDYNRPVLLLSEIDPRHLDIFEIIKNVIDARKHYNLISINSITKIFGSSTRFFINEFGPEHTIRAYLRHYIQETDRDIRFSFHNSYIQILQQNTPWADMVLSHTSPFIRAESDLGVLFRVFTPLKKVFSWHTISYVVLCILNHQDFSEMSQDVFYEKIFVPYKTDIILDNVIIFNTFDIFIRIWNHVNELYKHEMFVVFKDWIERDDTTTPTIKKVYLKSLIAITTEIHWLHLLYQINDTLGPSRVNILEEAKLGSKINIIEDGKKPLINKNNYSYIKSNVKGLFCLGCRTKLGNVNEDQNQCGSCLAIICNICYNIWFNHFQNPASNKKKHATIDNDLYTCLGSSLYGFTHNFFSTN